ncbi:MAG: GNAT family N-acetyltransferase [Phenylobacterium zucineum]|nr:MAG: GNAT family N-acetyltransferase [Phenylobacterium zucineum]
MRESLERIGRFDPDRARARFAAGFDPAHMRLVRLGEERVGCVTVRPETATLSWVEHLYIEPAHQGLGLGGEILRAILAEADAAGRTLRLSVLLDSNANRFYLRHGFSETHREAWDIYYEREPAGG